MIARAQYPALALAAVQSLLLGCNSAEDSSMPKAAGQKAEAPSPADDAPSPSNAPAAAEAGSTATTGRGGSPGSITTDTAGSSVSLLLQLAPRLQRTPTSLSIRPVCGGRRRRPLARRCCPGSVSWMARRSASSCGSMCPESPLQTP